MLAVILCGWMDTFRLREGAKLCMRLLLLNMSGFATPLAYHETHCRREKVRSASVGRRPFVTPTMLIFNTSIISLFILGMPVKSLYQICFDYIKEHTKDIASLEGVPFYPIVQSLLEHIFRSSIPLNSSILSIIADSYSKELRETNIPWGCVSLTNVMKPITPSLKAISLHFPRFITHLNIERSGLMDDHIHLLGNLSNLKSLRLGWNSSITDRGISYIANIANSPLPRGMHFLQELHLNDLPHVTDKSLKYIGQLDMLIYIDISHTDIIKEVALKYLPTKGFKRVPKQAENVNACAPHRLSEFNRTIELETKLQDLIQLLALKYQNGSYGNSSIPFRKFNFDTTNTQTILCFSRIRATNDSRLVTTAKKRSAKPMPNSRKRVAIRNQKRTTDDFLAMLENEMADDD